MMFLTSCGEEDIISFDSRAHPSANPLDDHQTPSPTKADEENPVDRTLERSGDPSQTRVDTNGLVPSESTLLSGDIHENRTLHRALSPYHLTGEVRVLQNARLVVQPGVTIIFDTNASLALGRLDPFGRCEDFGNLIAVGNSENPIVFRSENIGQTFGGITFDCVNHSNLNSIQNVQMIRAGSKGMPAVSVSVPSKIGELSNLVVDSVEGPLLYLAGEVDHVGTFQAVDSPFGIYASLASVAHFEGPFSTIFYNAPKNRGRVSLVLLPSLVPQNKLRIRGPGITISSHSRLQKLLENPELVSLEVGPGVHFTLDPSEAFPIGRYQGLLLGTAEEPIVLESLDENVWKGLEILSSKVTAPSRLENIIIRNAAIGITGENSLIAQKNIQFENCQKTRAAKITKALKFEKPLL